MNVFLDLYLSAKVLIFFHLTAHDVLGDEIYVGCYTNLSGWSCNQRGIPKLSDCSNHCRKTQFLFSSIKNGSTCCCGNQTNSKVPTSKCSLTCTNNGQRCGGSNFYAVYADIPTYLGCFNDFNHDRDMEVFIADKWFMTLDVCYKECSSRSHSFMGVQEGGTCICGPHYGKHGRAPEHECNKACNGDINQLCGSSSRNNIYSVGFIHALSRSYNEVFHCLDGKTHRNGACITNKCQPGWKGTKCNQKDCAINNENCGQHKCEENTFGGETISECVCSEGFQSNSIYDNCTDINECETDMCNSTTSYCNNTIGSYKCVCRTGFVENVSNHLLCDDVDECSEKPCIELSETCINTFGSFRCQCSPGYNYSQHSNCIDNLCSTSLYMCHNSSDCTKLQNYSCTSQGNNINQINEVKAGIVIGAVVGVILAFLIAITIIIIGYLMYYKRCHICSSCQEKSQGTKLDVYEVYSFYKSHMKDIKNQFSNCTKEFGHSQFVAVSPENVHKNRFKKMIPYDYNRVTLNEPPDYINASLIKTYGSPSNISFIAAQGPKVETYEDFWRMIWEFKVKIIIMLTKCFENKKEKCFKYWPDNGDITCGDFSITCEEAELRLNYEKRIFKVVHNNEVRKVVHFFYTAWEDKQVPDIVFSLMNLREKLISLIDKNSETNVVVHCSAGVGRTGTFIALDYLIRQAEQEDHVDIFECMKFLRNQRYNMIQAESQYLLCFRAMAMYHMIGKSTFVSCDILKRTDMSNNSLHKQFHLIEEEVGTREVEENNKTIIKYSSGPSDVIYVPSSQKPSSYAIGLMPATFCIEDLFSILNEGCNVCVFLDSQDLTFLPTDHERICCKNGFIQLTGKEETSVIRYSLKIERANNLNGNTYENNAFDNEHPYVNSATISTLIRVTQDVTISCDVIIQLYQFLKTSLNIGSKSIITILSRNGFVDSGFLVASLNVMQMVDLFKEVDLYETVFELRSIHPKTIDTFELFEKLHSFARRFLDQIGHIVNLGRKTLMKHNYKNEEIN